MFIYATKNMKSMGCFYSFLKVIIYKNKKYSTVNEEWIEFETAIITNDYVQLLHNHLSIS